MGKNRQLRAKRAAKERRWPEVPPPEDKISRLALRGGRSMIDPNNPPDDPFGIY
jgi:hypothetical protein